MICERLPTADEAFSLIQSNFTRRRLRCKAYECFPLAARRPAFHNRPQLQERAVSTLHIAMQQVSPEISAAFERRLDRARVPATQRPDYHKWVRFLLAPR